MEKLKYLELFAGTGIGGIALDDIGCENVGYSEFDKFAIQNYEANFPNRINYGDITKINEKELPNFDILIGVHLVLKFL
jgi:DNA (cytosine-5)-methyltransferase 1